MGRDFDAELWLGFGGISWIGGARRSFVSWGAVVCGVCALWCGLGVCDDFGGGIFATDCVILLAGGNIIKARL